MTMTPDQILLADAERFRLPEHLHQPIVRYILHRLRPGHFLSAVLANDLMGAVGRAGDGEADQLGRLVQFFYNCEAVPGNCWGSPEAVRQWLNPELATATDKEHQWL